RLAPRGRGLEEKGERSAAQFRERRHRGVGVQQRVAPDRNQPRRTRRPRGVDERAKPRCLAVDGHRCGCSGRGARRAFSVMRLNGAAIAAALVGVMCVAPVCRATAQEATWNDPRARALVEIATQRRARQLADSLLVDYRADAKGYVTFLAQLGKGFLEVPVLV